MQLISNKGHLLNSTIDSGSLSANLGFGVMERIGGSGAIGVNK